MATTWQTVRVFISEPLRIFFDAEGIKDMTTGGSVFQKNSDIDIV